VNLSLLTCPRLSVARVICTAVLTLGWACTSFAAPTAEADYCADYSVMRGESSKGDYFWCLGGAWHHVVPTFDPNSADGYGPTQLVPPLCVRFPDQYDCATERFEPPGY
jgi:hypothetical protein